MTESEQAAGTQNSAARHAIALAVGILSVVAFVFSPSGVVGYLLMIVVAAVAVVICHRAVRHRGPLLWMAIVGLVFAYLALVASVGVFVVHLVRMIGS